MAKRGKTPSLIGGSAGACTFVTAIRKRACKRCERAIPGGHNCIQVKIPSKMGYKCYCKDCFKEILGQTQRDLDNLVEQASAL